MKKLLLILTVVLSSAAFAETVDLTQELQDLESQYQQLASEEQARFNQEKGQADNARKALEKNEKLYAELTARAQKLSSEAATKFYKKQYEELAAKYKKALEQLNKEMEEQKAIIQDFEKIEALRAGNN